MTRRILRVVLCLAVFATVARGQVDVVGNSADIVVTGPSTSQAVFYKGGSDKTVSSITPIGPLAKGDGIELKDDVGPSPGTRSVRITVTEGARLERGKAYTGALILTTVAEDGTSTHLGEIPVTITRAAPSISVDAVHADLCVSCEGPHVVPVRIKNTGSVAFDRIRVGALTLHTSAHDWVVPAINGKNDAKDEKPTNPLTFDPGAEAPLTLAPGESRVIFISYIAPPFAGDYSGSIEISVGDMEPIKATVILRARGPNVLVRCFPLILFFAILLIGAWIAWRLEDHFGTGGGAVRGDAVLSLGDSERQLKLFQEWVNEWDATDPKKLGATRGRIGRDLVDVREPLDDFANLSPEALTQAAQDFRLRVAKRRAFRSRLLLAAQTLGAEAAARALDPVPDDGTLEVYKKALDDALPTPKAHDAAAGTVARAEEESDVFAELRSKQESMKKLRRWTVIAVSVLMAFLALYYGQCAFGSPRDYIETFFWGLGLTAAGNTLIREGNTKYKKEGEGG